MKSQDHGREFFAALDIGTDKVLCIVARPGAEPGSMRVIGMGNARSSGVQEGCVVDVQEAVQSIRKAVQEAQYTAEVQLFRCVGCDRRQVPAERQLCWTNGASRTRGFSGRR